MITINLSKILADKGMTQAELARLTSIRPSTICDIYNNNCDFVKLDYLDRICSALNIGTDQLLTYSHSLGHIQ